MKSLSISRVRPAGLRWRTGPICRSPPVTSSSRAALGPNRRRRAPRAGLLGKTRGWAPRSLLSEAISSQLGVRHPATVRDQPLQRRAVRGHLEHAANSIASVTIEQQVTRGLVITYITDVTTTQYQVIQIEYTINREFPVVALRDENGTFDLDVVRKTRFK